VTVLLAGTAVAKRLSLGVDGLMTWALAGANLAGAVSRAATGILGGRLNLGGMEVRHGLRVVISHWIMIA